MCLSGDTGILLVKPLLDTLRLLLIGSFHRLLRGESPPMKILSYCSNRKVHPIMLGNRFLYGFSCPQSKGQFQLVGRFIHEHTLYTPFLLAVKSPLVPKTTTPFPGFETIHPFPLIDPPPSPNRPSRHLKNSRYLVLFHALPEHPNTTTTKLILGFTMQLSGISSFHAGNILHSYPKCYLFICRVNNYKKVEPFGQILIGHNLARVIHKCKNIFIFRHFVPAPVYAASERQRYESLGRKKRRMGLSRGAFSLVHSLACKERTFITLIVLINPFGEQKNGGLQVNHISLVFSLIILYFTALLISDDVLFADNVLFMFISMHR